MNSKTRPDWNRNAFLLREAENQVKSGGMCKCWWCGSTDKNYYIELCYNCTQTIDEIMFVGLFGQGKYDRYCVFWDGLKTIVCQMNVKPSMQLLLAYKAAENRQNFGPDIPKTLEILEKQGELVYM